MWHIHGILNVWHFIMPLAVTSKKTQTHLCRHGCVPDYINILAIVVSCSIAQMKRMLLALLYLMMIIYSIESSLRPMILPSMGICVGKRLMALCVNTTGSPNSTNG